MGMLSGIYTDIYIYMWIKTIEDAYEHCLSSQWREACAYMSIEMGCAPDAACDQEIIDLAWKLTGVQVLPVFRAAFFMALLDMPLQWDDRQEDARVSHLASHLQLSRVRKAKVIKGSFAKDNSSFLMASRKLHHCLGRCWE